MPTPVSWYWGWWTSPSQQNPSPPCEKRATKRAGKRCAKGDGEAFDQVELAPDGTEVSRTRYCIKCVKNGCTKGCKLVLITVHLPNGNTMTDFKCRCSAKHP